MADLKARMRQLQGTTAEWASNDLILGDGEIAFEVTSADPLEVFAKVGNGVLPFSQCPVLGFIDLGSPDWVQPPIDIKSVAGAGSPLTYTTIADDQHKLLITEDTTEVILSIDNGLYAIGETIEILQGDVGRVVLDCVGGSIFTSIEFNTAINSIYSVVTVLKINTNIWVAFGKLETN